MTLGCNQKWVAEETGTSIAMLQENYGKYIRDDGDALLRAYVTSAESEEQKMVSKQQETETFLGEGVKYAGNMASPTGFETVASLR